MIGQDCRKRQELMPPLKLLVLIIIVTPNLMFFKITLTAIGNAK